MLERYFDFEKNNTDLKIEILAGITTFLSAMYIIVVNPSILVQAGMPFNAVLTATVVLSAFCTIMMGLYAKNPILVAPGMGINAFFALSVVNGLGVPWQTALGAVFWAGIVFLLLSVFNIRTYIVNAIPRQIRFAVSAGIGLFIALIGLLNAKFITANPATIMGIGQLNSVTITFLAGLLITSVLIIKRIKGAMVIGIVATTILAIPIGRFYGDASSINFGIPTLVTWNGIFDTPDFSLLGKLDLLGSLKFALWPVIFAFLFTDMFDSLSTFIGVAEAADLVDEKGEPRNVKESLIVDSIATALAGILGTSPGTAYIESATGVKEGGRTGMTTLVAGLLFIPFMFISPLLSVVPSIATAPALVLVGVFMMKPVLKINWTQLDDSIPAFIALITIPFTYSITEGIVWGFLSWTVIKLLTGKLKDITLTLLIIDVFAIISLIISQK